MVMKNMYTVYWNSSLSFYFVFRGAKSLISLLKLPRELIHRIERKPQMLILNLFPFTECKRMCRPRSILNLPPINTARSQIPDLLLRDTLGG